MLIWITGLSGAGKSTLATGLQGRFAGVGQVAVLLDGDRLREVLGKVDALSATERRELAHTYARLCHYLSAQGATVICATISMFHDVREWNRANNAQYLEVYLRVPEAERLARDAKGVYTDSPGAKAPVAFNDAFEEPTASDVVIDNHGPTSARAALDEVWRLLTNRGWTQCQAAT